MIDDIPANEVIVMTEIMERLFKVANCDPACHCCRETIEVGAKFKLSTAMVRTSYNAPSLKSERDIMLCDNCDTDKLIAREKRDHRALLKWRRENPRAGYSRPTRGKS